MSLFQCFSYFIFSFLFVFPLCQRVNFECGPWDDIWLTSSMIQLYSRFVLCSKSVCMTTSQLFLYLLLTISYIFKEVTQDLLCIHTDIANSSSDFHSSVSNIVALFQCSSKFFDEVAYFKHGCSFLHEFGETQLSETFPTWERLHIKLLFFFSIRTLVPICTCRALAATPAIRRCSSYPKSFFCFF